MEQTYAEVGTEVVIGFRGKCNDYRFIEDMGRLRYTKTIITEVRINTSNEAWCHVLADNTRWWWPAYDMILASDIDLLTPEQKAKIR